MSGTTGTVRITPIPHAVSVGLIRRGLGVLGTKIRRIQIAGGVPTPIALPMAAVITAAIAWLVISIASMWVTV